MFGKTYVRRRRRTVNNDPGSQLEEKVAHEEQLEMEEQQKSDEETDLTRPFPGGPQNPSLLRSFKCHVAAKIWTGVERELLRVHCHSQLLLEWNVPIEPETDAWRKLFRPSNFGNMVGLAYTSPNRALISAFVERWQPETNTFHLPFGEMTITLDDVACLTGLRVDGHICSILVSVDDGEIEDPAKYVARLLGVSYWDAKKEIQTARGSSLKLSWLRDRFMQHMTLGETFRQYAARAYMLYVIGCILFPDKSGNRVQTHYLVLLENLDKVCEVAWGAGVLAFLYRQLGVTTRYKVRQFNCFIPLLEAWIYEHIPCFRPAYNTDYNHNKYVRAMRWSPPSRNTARFQDLVSYRNMLDSLTELQVQWTPYADVREYHPLQDIVWYRGLIRSFGILEPYFPDRVLRQFGHVQMIPFGPIEPNLATRPGAGQSYSLVWSDDIQENYCDWKSHVLSVPERGRQAIHPWMCTPDYILWYREHSHPLVKNRPQVVRASTTTTIEQLWEQLQIARAYLQSPMQMWGTNNDMLTLEYAMSQMNLAYTAIGGDHDDTAETNRGIDISDKSTHGGRRVRGRY